MSKDAYVQVYQETLIWSPMDLYVRSRTAQERSRDMSLTAACHSSPAAAWYERFIRVVSMLHFSRATQGSIPRVLGAHLQSMKIRKT